MVTVTQKCKVSRIYLILVEVFLALMGTGCLEDPIRSHPLDPLGENFLNEGAISVQVTSFYPPRSGLSNVNVAVLPKEITGHTDATGSFDIQGLSAGEYNVRVTEVGYATIDTLIRVSAGEISHLELPLAGLPTFSDVQIHSLHVSRWFPPPEELFSLEIVAELDDNDGVADIDSLWVDIDKFSFTEALFVQVEPGKYIHSIPSEALPISMSTLLGHEILLRAKDRSGVSNTSSPGQLIRVIQETPLALDPNELALISTALPTFSWEGITLEYPFTFRVDVVRINQEIQSTIQILENIPSTATEIQTTEPLETGDYFWTISVVDEFGNRSRSREAGFRIQ